MFISILGEYNETSTCLNCIIPAFGFYRMFWRKG